MQVIKMIGSYIGLAHFTDLIDELERAISGAKYGDYIMSGTATLGDLPLHHHIFACHLTTPYHMYLQSSLDLYFIKICSKFKVTQMKWTS